MFFRCGNFDNTFSIGEDTDFFYRLKKVGININNRIDKIFYMRRLHGKNISLTKNGNDVSKIMSKILRKKLVGYNSKKFKYI